MKLAAAITTVSLLAPTALANTQAPHVARDIATIKNVLSDIDTQVTSLNDAITAQPVDADAIVKQANTLSGTISQGVTTVNSQEMLGQLDALGLVSPTEKLAKDTESSVKALVGIKPQVLKLGKGCVSLQSLEKLHDGAIELSGAIVSKVPEALGNIAKNLSDKISAAIQDGVDAFQGACDKAAAAPAPAPAATQQPAAQQPAAQEPAAQEPATHQTAPEQPAAAPQESAPAAEAPAPQSPKPKGTCRAPQ